MARSSSSAINSEVPTDIECFERCEMRRGADVLLQESGVIGGMLGVLNKRDADIAPLLVATACPSGALTVECYAQLKQELLHHLSAALPVDGLLLALHGAAAADGTGDIEGDLLTAVREITGQDLPIVVTLDLHAHITEPMVQHADALIAWETYPHHRLHSTVYNIKQHSCAPFTGGSQRFVPPKDRIPT